MTPRQRVLAALQHQQPDRVPLDIGGTESSGMTAIAYNRLRKHLGMPAGTTQVFDVYQQVIKIEDDLREALQIDTVPLLIEPRQWQPSLLPDGSPCEVPAKWNPQKEGGDWVVRNEADTVIARMPESGFYFEPVHTPLADVTELAELDEHTDSIESFDWPGYADETLADIAARARRLFDETNYAIVANLQCHLLAAGQMLRGYENFMIDLLADKPLAHALLERLTDAYKRRADTYLGRVGEHIQVVLVNDDLGTQNGPMMSAECYREMLWPYQKELFGFIKSRTDAPLLLHSCGAVAEYIPALLEAGVDALNPVQVSAAGMDTADLKRQFGDRLTFWGGGCDTQHILCSGSPGEIENEVKRRIDDLAAGGGFIFTQVHNIQPDVPPENAMAMLEALAKFGRYD
ncbi:MAG: uroporphyrinogen decarboxylase family protein [Planctomycetota bacterium]|jgi:uroporphyrinogen decarboxylase